MDADLLAMEIAARLGSLPGVAAVVIGGSRGRGSHRPASDLDLGIYYHPDEPLDIPLLDCLAASLDDERRAGLLTQPGGWGPWVNGGGWLKIHGLAVDFLYRDLTRVAQVIEDSRRGVISMHYQPGHPHGFPSYIYMSEAATCRVLHDPRGALAALREKTDPYPPALCQAVIDAFFWESDFSLQIARKGAAQGDCAYVAGCCFRALSCLLQTLFALNRVYWLNEKGALALADRFELRPPHLRQQVEVAFSTLSGDSRDLETAVERMSELVRAVQSLVEGC